MTKIINTKNIDVSISEDLVPFLYRIKDGKTVNDKLIISSVVGLFVSKIITLEKAGELTGNSIWDFIDILKFYHIPWGECTEEDLKMDEIALEKVFSIQN